MNGSETSSPWQEAERDLADFVAFVALERATLSEMKTEEQRLVDEATAILRKKVKLQAEIEKREKRLDEKDQKILQFRAKIDRGKTRWDEIGGQD